MKYNQSVELIKERLPLAEVVEHYTGEKLTKGKIRCPLHNEKTASFTVYPNNTFYCFGCGASGDVLKFVQAYFNIGFKEALMRLDYDFNLGLTNAPKLSEYRRQIKAIAERKAERQRAFKEAERLNNEYWRLFDIVLNYERIIKDRRPLSPEDEAEPKFLEALQNIEYARHCLDCAENERKKIKNE